MWHQPGQRHTGLIPQEGQHARQRGARVVDRTLHATSHPASDIVPVRSGHVGLASDRDDALEDRIVRNAAETDVHDAGTDGGDPFGQAGRRGVVVGQRRNHLVRGDVLSRAVEPRRRTRGMRQVATDEPDDGHLVALDAQGHPFCLPRR